MLSNITSINLDLQTQGSALVAKQINALVSPARRIYVFGTATDAFPYFSTFANALTYANSLTPSTTNPVSIVLLSNTNGTPVEISGADDWYALCLDGIYVSSPYREIFSTTTLPTTLPKGMRVMYEDANGVESLWVGNADGNAWPAVGYKEYVALLSQESTSAPTADVKINTTGINPTFNYIEPGGYSITGFGSDSVYNYGVFTADTDVVVRIVKSGATILLGSEESSVPTNGLISAYPISIRIYP